MRGQDIEPEHKVPGLELKLICAVHLSGACSAPDKAGAISNLLSPDGPTVGLFLLQYKEQLQNF